MCVPQATTDFYSQTYFHSRTEMICLKTKYFYPNRILLLALGLWPYYQSNFVRLQIIFYLSILISCIIFQVSIYYIIPHNFNCIVILFYIFNYIIINHLYKLLVIIIILLLTIFINFKY